MPTMKLDNVDDIYPLSPMQQGMLFHTISEPNSGVYIDQVAVTLEGRIEVDGLLTALQNVASRHPSLRTAFVWDGVDHPLQIVREKVEFPVNHFDWTDFDSEQQRQRLKETIEHYRKSGFDLAVAPLLRFSVFCYAENRLILLLTFHHLILDGWSTHVLLKEILEHLRSLDFQSTPSPHAFEFKDYITWIQNQDQVATNAFWKKELEGFESANLIGPPVEGTGKKTDYRQTSLKLNRETTTAVKALARNCEVTLNTVVQAAWGLTVSRYAGGDRDIVFGTTVAGRPLELPGIESAVGSFINTLPLRMLINPNQSFITLLRQIQSSQLDVRRWEASSLVEIQKQSNLPAGESLFENIFVFENYPAAEPQNADLQVVDIEHFERSNYPLALLVVPSDAMEFIAVHSMERYSTKFSTRMLEHVRWVLEQFIHHPGKLVEEFLGLPSEHAKSMLQIDDPTHFPVRAAEEKFVDQMFVDIATANPNAIAATQAGISLTYHELNLRADQVATALRSRGLQAGSIVGVCAPRSFEMLIGIVGVLKAGAAYLPLDVDYPESYLSFVLADADVQFVLANSRSGASLPKGKYLTLMFEDIAGDVDAVTVVDRRRLSRTSPGECLAYVIYTSGSTGQPKGVKISHANLAYSNWARQCYYDASPERFLLLSSFAFDSSVAGIFWTLLSAGTLVLPEPEQEKDVEAIAELIDQAKVTHLLGLPSLYRLLLEAADDRQLGSLHTAIVAGEAIGTSTVVSHFDRLPVVQLHNEYGPTEATVWASAYQVTAEDRQGDTPIGSAIPGAAIMLLDSSGKPVAYGAVGEICIGGPGIATGYWNRDQLTQERFVMVDDLAGDRVRVYRTGDAGYLRDDGNLMFAGRIDRQIKIRGHRIEPTAVERHLLASDRIDDAFVTAVQFKRPGLPPITRLVAYIVAGKVEQSAIKEALSQHLPEFMIPDVLVCLDAFPKLANGKVDTGSLPEPTFETPSGSAYEPRNETEATLVQIWRDTIGVADIGIDQNFFALGGDSIIGIQVISRARRAGIFLHPKHIAQYPTIIELAALATAESNESDETADDGDIPLSPIQQWFFSMEMPEPHHWNQSALFELPPTYDSARLETALFETIAVHPMLHARFLKNEASQWRQFMAEPMPSFEIDLVDFEDATFAQARLKFESSLDLKTGPLFRLAIFQNPMGRDRLLFVAHHLVVDAVSWRILKDDIESRLQSDQHTPTRATQSFGQFTKQLYTHVAEAQPEEKSDYWRHVLNAGKDARLPLVSNNRPTTESSVRVETRHLDSAQTRLLLQDANDAFSTSPYQLLLAALTLAVADWTGGTKAFLNLESHGRDGEALADLDLSRTVGWMTSVYPVTLEVADGDVVQTVKSVKDQMNFIPTGGIDFGALCYLPATAEEFSAAPTPDILFNYLGIQVSTTGAVLTFLNSSVATSRAASNIRQHPIEINAMIQHDRLNVAISYCQHRLDNVVAQQFADHYVGRLQEILTACCDSKRSLTASDFPDAELSQSELDDFLDSLD